MNEAETLLKNRPHSVDQFIRQLDFCSIDMEIDWEYDRAVWTFEDGSMLERLGDLFRTYDIDL